MSARSLPGMASRTSVSYQARLSALDSMVVYRRIRARPGGSLRLSSQSDLIRLRIRSGPAALVGDRAKVVDKVGMAVPAARDQASDVPAALGVDPVHHLIEPLPDLTA